MKSPTGGKSRVVPACLPCVCGGALHVWTPLCVSHVCHVRCLCPAGADGKNDAPIGFDEATYLSESATADRNWSRYSPIYAMHFHT